MGRYTTIQTFADNNPSVPKLPYDEAALKSSQQANESKGEFGTGVTVEKVNNVMGSTAGAGSGDFHHYRHCRRREMERIDGMEKRAEQDEALLEFETRVETKRKECEERTRKNAEKRKRKKGKKAGGNEFTKAGAVAAAAREGGGDESASESEFTYVPLALGAAAGGGAAAEGEAAAEGGAAAAAVASSVAKAVVANDGSFLARAKALAAATKK